MKHLRLFLATVIGIMILSPLSSFAASLTNFSYSGDSYAPGAHATYTFTYTTTTALGPSDYLLYVIFGSGFDTGHSENSLNVTVNGVSKTIVSFWNVGQQGAFININQSVSSGSTIVVTIGNVVNPSSPGTYPFTWLRTSTGGGNEIDGASPSPVVIAAADTTPPIQSALIVTPGKTDATVSLTTDEAATSSISYGLTSSYGSTATISNSLATSHSGSISGLSNCGVIYHYQISTTDAANNTSTSSDATFVTHCGSGYSAPLPESETTIEKNIPNTTPQPNTVTENTSPTKSETQSIEVIKTETPVNTPTLQEKIVVKPTISQPFITSYIKFGGKNNPEDVKKLQVFLNSIEGEHLIVDGVYKKADVEAIKRFQKKYAQAILNYWHINKPTGCVYINTIEMINKLVREKIGQ